MRTQDDEKGEGVGGWRGDVPAFSNSCARSFQFGWNLLAFLGFLNLKVVVERSLSLNSFRTASSVRVIRWNVVGLGF